MGDTLVQKKGPNWGHDPQNEFPGLPRIGPFLELQHSSNFLEFSGISLERALGIPEWHFRGNPVSPYPLNLGGEDSPPKFRGRPSKNSLKQGALDPPPPKFRGWGGGPTGKMKLICLPAVNHSLSALHPLNLRGESSPPKFKGYGLTGFVSK